MMKTDLLSRDMLRGVDKGDLVLHVELGEHGYALSDVPLATYEDKCPCWILVSDFVDILRSISKP
jgi:hypothetical protein